MSLTYHQPILIRSEQASKIDLKSYWNRFRLVDHLLSAVIETVQPFYAFAAFSTAWYMTENSFAYEWSRVNSLLIRRSLHFYQGDTVLEWSVSSSICSTLLMNHRVTCSQPFKYVVILFLTLGVHLLLHLLLYNPHRRIFLFDILISYSYFVSLLRILIPY